MSKALSFILDLLSRVSLASQEKIFVVHKKYLQIFPEALDLYPTVFTLDPEGESKTSGNLMSVRCRPLEQRKQISQISRSEISEYEALAEMLTFYMSPKTTSFVSIVTNTRDESLLVAREVLRSMRNQKIESHILLLLDFDYIALDDSDKVNLAFLVSDLIPHGRYTILPISFERVMRSSLKMEVVDYVKKCIAELIAELHERPLVGTYVPLCFRLEPLSMFRDLIHAFSLVFFIFTGRVKLLTGNFALGSITVPSGLSEEILKIEKDVDRVRISHTNSDTLDVKALVEFSLRDIITEGVDLIAKSASLSEAVEVLTNLKYLNLIKV
ncbi:MAG: hypothetical protein RMI56_02155 [Sulfolobales archaeon]|nr:hypothetical protein [Sulfolobales archaeon]MDW8082580.1 hypothetical protein [Sulfolobales archaeon]